MSSCFAEQRSTSNAVLSKHPAGGPGLLVPTVKPTIPPMSALVTNATCTVVQQSPLQLTVQGSTSPSSSNDSTSSCTQPNTSTVAPTPAYTTAASMSRSPAQLATRSGVAPIVQQQSATVHQQQHLLLSAVLQPQHQLQQLAGTKNANKSGVTPTIRSLGQLIQERGQQTAASALVQSQQAQFNCSQVPGQPGSSGNVILQVQQQQATIPIIMAYLYQQQQQQQTRTALSQLLQKQSCVLAHQKPSAALAVQQQAQRHLVYHAGRPYVLVVPTGAIAQQQRLVMSSTTGVTQVNQQRQQQQHVMLNINSKRGLQEASVAGHTQCAAGSAAANLAVASSTDIAKPSQLLAVSEPAAKRQKLTTAQQQQQCQQRPCSQSTGVPQHPQEVTAANAAAVAVQPTLLSSTHQHLAAAAAATAKHSNECSGDSVAAPTTTSCQASCGAVGAAAQQSLSHPSSAAEYATSVIADIRKRLVLQECAKHLGAPAAAAAGSTVGAAACANTSATGSPRVEAAAAAIATSSHITSAPPIASEAPASITAASQSTAAAADLPDGSQEHQGNSHQQRVAAVFDTQQAASKQQQQQQVQSGLLSDGVARVAGNVLSAAAAQQPVLGAGQSLLQHNQLPPANAVNSTGLTGSSLALMLQQQQRQLLSQRQCLMQQQQLLRQHLQQMPQPHKLPHATAAAAAAVGDCLSSQVVQQPAAVLSSLSPLQNQLVMIQQQQQLAPAAAASTKDGDAGVKHAQQLQQQLLLQSQSQHSLCQHPELKVALLPDQPPPKYMRLQQQGYMQQRRRGSQSWAWLQNLGNTTADAVLPHPPQRRRRSQANRQQQHLGPGANEEQQRRQDPEQAAVEQQQQQSGDEDMELDHCAADLEAAELLMTLSGL